MLVLQEEASRLRSVNLLRIPFHFILFYSLFSPGLPPIGAAALKNKNKIEKRLLRLSEHFAVATHAVMPRLSGLYHLHPSRVVESVALFV